MFFRTKIQKTELLINKLSEEELNLAHDKIAQRLLLLRNEQQAQVLQSFKIGDKVYFDYKNERIEGAIIKLNKISAKVIDTRDRRWKISPSFLNKFT